jgi:hypothetical protein
VVLLLILIMNVLNNYCMLLMIMCGGIKITALEESVDFAILDTEKLFGKLKSYKLPRKGHLNHDASVTSKTLITSARVGGHDANPTITVSSTLEFDLSSLAAAFDAVREYPQRRHCPAGKKVLHLAQVPQGEEEITQGLF